jgi:hypothetical protein
MEREKVFGACLVETGVVDVHLKFPIGLGDNNMVCQPPRVVGLPYEASVKQLLELFTDEVLPLNGLLSGLLLHQTSIGVDLQMVLNHLPRHPKHLWWLLGKHINIVLKEGDECKFLCVAQIPRDAGNLGGIRADLDDLHRNILTVWGLHIGCRGWDALLQALWCLV